MPRRQAIPIELTLPQMRLLAKYHKGSLTMGFSRRILIRVDVIMRAARGQTNYMIAKQLGISRNTVKLWRSRFAKEGLAGLVTRPIPGRPRKVAKQIQTGDTGIAQQVVAQCRSIPSNQPELAKS